jgi:hypothetical protein
MKRRIAAGCLISLLITGSFFGALTGVSGDSDSVSSAEAAVSTVSGTASEAESDAASGADSGQIRETESGTDTEEPYTVDIGDSSFVIDQEAVEKNIEAIRKLFTSEDFQHLISYEEVRDLAQYIFTRALDFVKNEPDLATKVLEALGLDKKVTPIVIEAVALVSKTGEELTEYLESEEGQKISEAAVGLLNNPVIAAELKELNQIIERAVS